MKELLIRIFENQILIFNALLDNPDNSYKRKIELKRNETESLIRLLKENCDIQNMPQSEKLEIFHQTAKSLREGLDSWKD